MLETCIESTCIIKNSAPLTTFMNKNAVYYLAVMLSQCDVGLMHSPFPWVVYSN